MKNISAPETNFAKNTFCSYCGTKFTEQILWPRKCFRCYNESYANPTPVVVALIEVYDTLKCPPNLDNDVNLLGQAPHTSYGILIQQRNIDPKKGEWCLPCGYQNLGETWQEGIAREVQEEMGLITKPEDYELFDVCMGTHMNTLLVFAQHRFGVHLDEIKFEPNHEVSAMKIVNKSEDLAFPSHTTNLKRFLG